MRELHGALNPMAETVTMQIAQVVPCTEAEGPGRRFALWFQGCPLRCPGCCNLEMLSFAGGQGRSVEEVHAEIRRAREASQIEGLTLLGGEPFAHAVGAAELAARVQADSLSVMIFSGYTLAELRAMSDPAVHRLLAHTDILVDGPYFRELPETRRRWIGSANQQIHFLTDRDRADEGNRIAGADTIEDHCDQSTREERDDDTGREPDRHGTKTVLEQQPHHVAAAGADGDTFFLFSGAELSADPHGKPARRYLKDAYAFKRKTGWRKLADLPRPAVAAPSPAIRFNQKLLIVSGDDGALVNFEPKAAHPGFPKDILAYDIHSDQWTRLGNAPFSRATAPVVQWNKMAVILNGEPRPGRRTPEVWALQLP
jgi:anaerobic ribonucleoside-triphosphate reductase activating protein